MSASDPVEIHAWLEFPADQRISVAEMCTIGRDPKSTVVIPSERVSRRHAVIRSLPDGTFQIMDMGSANGTYVNGARLQRPMVLRNGNLVEVGGQKFTFRATGTSRGHDADTQEEEACWFVSLEAVYRGSPEGELGGEKTRESWSARCERLLPRLRAKVIRPGGDGLLFYWPGKDIPFATVSMAVRALREAEQSPEQFHFTVHHGNATFRTNSAGARVPGGPAAVHAFQMQRLLRTLGVKVIFSAAAKAAAGEAAELRPLNTMELKDTKLSERFYTWRI